MPIISIALPLLAGHAVPAGRAVASLRPTELRCEAMTAPVGIGTASPRLSWKLVAVQKNSRNLSQSAYRIRVGSVPGSADLWDSGRVDSRDTYGVAYQGKPLGSNQLCWWQVQVTDQAGATSAWTAPTKWSTGLLKKSDWKAQWIGFDAPGTMPSAAEPLSTATWIWSGAEGPGSQTFRKQIRVAKPIAKAMLRLTADDQFVASLNGTEVSRNDNDTDSWRRPVSVDLTKLLRTGVNVISVVATNGEGQAGLIGILTLTYTDGKTESIVTDTSWQSDAVVRSVGAFGAAPWGKIGQTALTLPSPRLLRNEFSLNKPIKRAVVYASALGLIHLNLNGKSVSDELFVPGWTDYTKRVYARGYDVTNSLRVGKNAIGAALGDGWYSGYVGYGRNRDLYGKKPRALIQLNVEFTDGTKTVVGSSPDWRASTGPMLESDFLMGEQYDARRELPGWDRPGYASQWKPVDTGAEVKPAVEPFPGQPVKAFAELRAKTITEPTKGAFVLDLGQNIAGFARLRVQGKRGQKITLRFAERLNPNGTIYVTNLRSARTIDTYICRGGAPEVWQPKFTFHGFQYIEVTGLGRKPNREEVVGIAVSSDTPRVGTLQTSDSLLNKLVSNAWWTQRMNFIDIPTDCPQRDERLGWTGDAQAYVRTASMLADVQPFFTKWLVSLDDGQRADGQYPMVAPVKVAGDDGGPAWADAGVICPWTIYDTYGDRELLARHYPNMKRFVEFCEKRSTADLLPPAQFHCFGDWLNINSPTPNEVIYSAYFAGSTRILAQAARVLGKEADAVRYEALYSRLRDVFTKTYVSDDGTVRGDSQCGYVLALAFDLLPKELATKAADRLVADIEKRGWHLSTGFVGTRDIMHVLSKIGRNDVAFRLLHNKTFPSWGFTIVNGATSIWERWDGWTPEKGFQDPGMNSFSHYAFGAVVGWMFDQPAGISNLTPGFEKVKIAPQIDPNLKWLKSSYNSVRGPIVSNWSVKDQVVTMNVTIPPNVSAEVHVPGGKTVTVGSGTYTFTGRTSSAGGF
jgi:alpha-L-rhamnosidase